MLKLVRPGGIVEVYTHPIRAAEIMERYPRHFVTRPDVFKFPYIVVKPESILKPGRVFFIVPYHTIYRLLQSKGSIDKQAHPIFKDEGHDSDAASSSYFSSRNTRGLKPCLRKNRKNRTQYMQGPKVRFMLPDEDGDYDENWGTGFSYF